MQPDSIGLKRIPAWWYLLWAPTLCVLAMIVEVAVFHVQDPGAIAISVVVSLTLGMLAIALPDRLRTAGVIGSAIGTPVLVSLLGNSVYLGYINANVDPLAIVVALMWALLLLPAAIGFALSIRPDMEH